MSPKPKKGTSKDGKAMHYSAGAVIEKDGKIFLIDRAVPPLGFAGPAGHIDEGEEPEESLKREVKEETGLDVTQMELLFNEELDWNWCSKGVGVHQWYLYKCQVSGEINRNKRETKSAGWYDKSEIKKLRLEPVWEYWFTKLGYINKSNNFNGKVTVVLWLILILLVIYFVVSYL